MHANDFYVNYASKGQSKAFFESATKEEVEKILRSILEFAFVGTCQTLDEILEDYGLTQEDFEGRLPEGTDFNQIYDEICFSCDHCGWNYSKEEANNYYGNCICNSCYDEMIEEEEEEWESEDDDDEEY